MSTSMSQGESGSKLFYKYFTSWSITSMSSLGTKSMKLPSFSPLPNSDVAFYFEIWYQEKDSGNEQTSYFKMVLAKLPGANVPQSFKMKVTVFVHSTNGNLLKKYEHSDVSVGEMDSNSLTIASEIYKLYVYDQISKRYKETRDPHFGKYPDLIIKCHVLFHEHLPSPAAYFQNMKKLKNLEEFVSDFSSIYQPSVLSDIEFKIGNESLPAHKSILAAQSPVFQRMICNDFLESKTNTISINDSSPEIFNSFLKYLYSGEIEDKSWLVVKKLYRLADIYDVRSLKTESGEVIASILSVDNACEILKMAYEYGDEYLKQEANIFAVKRILEIAPKDDWKELVKTNPMIGYNVMNNFAPKFQLVSLVDSSASIELAE